jgi:hypothetical protein
MNKLKNRTLKWSVSGIYNRYSKDQRHLHRRPARRPLFTGAKALLNCQMTIRNGNLGNQKILLKRGRFNLGRTPHFPSSNSILSIKYYSIGSNCSLKCGKREFGQIFFSTMESDLVQLFSGIGLNDQKAIEAAQNKKLRSNLEQAILAVIHF